MTANTVYFVTGANRGIGLELVTQLAARPSTVVYGTARNLSAAKELHQLAAKYPNFKPLEADVTKQDTIEAAAKLVDEEQGHVDILLSNAALADEYVLVKDFEVDSLSRFFETNTKGPIIVYKAFRPLLLKSTQEKKLVFLSTIASSISQYYPLPCPAYGASKAAMNYLVRAIAAESKDDGFKVISLHPGAVSTDAGKLGAQNIDFAGLGIEVITPAKSAERVLAITDELDVSDKFYSYTGDEMKW
ncbi:unnamed protein product [Kuraishia capsulata CBS 1993]|uniref:NAD(P)-binding protein n=1 Tax=Kuraishia capsulata CBS 1993 TaxID=1382522 RepID=W6MSH4_9ASCO|nr:uncharacterized protein KUCA_T00005749001 [Kuraishia capsulata CBS 1993]CDK29756.1 unnamed protein product [Kuraishia capsulata CBS 1993]